MAHERRGVGGQRLATVLSAALLLGCQTESTHNMDEPISAYRDRMLVQHEEEAKAATQPARSGPPRPPLARPVAGQAALLERASLMTQPATSTQPTPQEVLIELPDPVDAAQTFAQRVERLRREQEGRPDQRVVRNYERVAEQADAYLKLGERPERFRLSLAEAVQRALENNYTIRIEAHNPAISQTQIVEAEAAFDVEFYLDTSWQNLDGAVPPHSYPNITDTRSIQGGFRKLLPTGMQASVGLGTSRIWNGASNPSQVKSWNPTWPSNFIGELRQPLLRGFGLDVNRAQIHIRNLEYKISQETFAQRVRDTLLDVETAYWELSLARRRAVILAETTAQNLVTFQNMVERLDHDATQVEVENSKSRWQTSYVSFLETLKLLRDTEDRLKNLLNDADLKLSMDVEIVPIETPFAAPMAVDHFAELRTALERRSEIQQAKHRIEQTRVNTVVAKNQILPQLDLSFQYEVQGLGNTADNSFDNLTTNRFISYTLGASFSYNFGERRARAGLRRAHLQESQAIVALNQVSDAVVEEVNGSIRQLVVRYTQIPPALVSVQSAEKNLRALQARTQRIDPSYLQTELGAVEQLGNTRSTLLRVLTDYNEGIVQLEKAKGTLLDYNNIAVSDVQPPK